MNLYLLATIVFFCNWFIPATVLAQNTVSSNLAFVGAKIYPSPNEPPIFNGIVLVKNGKIKTVGENGKVKIPRGSQIIDCRGLTLTSGFWNSHIHFIEIKWENSATKPAAILSQQLSDMLNRYGFTTVFDTGSVWAETTSYS